ncbi:MAG: C10 family peptidase [Myxococcota bacterium]|nr:C10 family peptidase [Myxococcota bacterium]
MANRARWILVIIFLSATVVGCASAEFEGSDAGVSEREVAINWMRAQYPQRQSFEIEEVYYDNNNKLNPNIGFEFEGGGFVIVSASDEDIAVLAYSNDSHLFDEEADDIRVNSFMRNLKVVAKPNQFSQDENGQKTSYSTALSTVVEPLIKTTWGQSGGYYPNFTYNKMTPSMSAREKAPVGCVAVAFGQVLNYYQFPKNGIGYKKYCNGGGSVSTCPAEQIVEADYRTGYAWENMPAKLTYSSNAAQVDAVAKLLYHVGASVNATYGAKGTSAQIANPTVFTGFRRQFKMADVMMVSKSKYSDAQWEELIKNEIVNERPVVFFGEDVNVGAGHAYILDGIDKNGYVHVNFGWNGSANGYYNINSLVVDNKYKFTDDLNAYIKFVPAITVVQKNYVMTLKPGEWREIEVDAGTQDFDFGTVEDIKVEMNYSGQWRGDADLYVKKGSKITSPSDFDCAPQKGSSIETCYLKGRGNYFIAINGYNDYGQKSDSPITLKVTYKVYAE